MAGDSCDIIRFDWKGGRADVSGAAAGPVSNPFSPQSANKTETPRKPAAAQPAFRVTSWQTAGLGVGQAVALGRVKRVGSGLDDGEGDGCPDGAASPGRGGDDVLLAAGREPGCGGVGGGKRLLAAAHGMSGTATVSAA